MINSKISFQTLVKDLTKYESTNHGNPYMPSNLNNI